MAGMTAVPLEQGPRDEALRAAVELLRREHEDVTVTENGERIAVLVDPDVIDSLRETVEILTTPGELDEIKAGHAELEQGLDVHGPSVLAKYLRD